MFVPPRDRVMENSTSNSQTVFAVTGAIDSSFNPFGASMAVGDTTVGGVVEPGVAFKSGILTCSNTGEITVSVAKESKGTFSAGGIKQVFMGLPASLAQIAIFTPDAEGAFNDGSHNDTVAIAAAAVAAAAKGTGLKLLSGGGYLISPIQFGGAAPNSCSFTASLAPDNTMTVATPPAIPIVSGQSISAVSGLTSTTITGQLSGVPGGIGVYIYAGAPQTVASRTITTTAPTFTASIAVVSGVPTMNVAAVGNGKLQVGDALSAAVLGTTILSQSSGTTGGIGIYVVSWPQTLGSTAGMRAYPVTVAPLPSWIRGEHKGQTVLRGDPAGGPYAAKPLVTIVDSIATSTVPYGFEIEKIRINANANYQSPLQLRGFTYATASELFLQNGTGFGMVVIGNAATGGVIYTGFMDIDAQSNGGGGFLWNGDNADGSFNIQSVYTRSLRAISNTGPGWKGTYANTLNDEPESESNSGLPIDWDFSNHVAFEDGYTEFCGGQVSGTANSQGFRFTGQALDGVNATLMASATAHIDYYNGTVRIRNFGAMFGINLKVTGSAGAGFVEMVAQSSAPSQPVTGVRLYADSTLQRLGYIDANGKNILFDISSLGVTPRAYAWPDVSGIVTLNGATQTLSLKTLDNTNTVTLKDTLFTLQDDGDATKQARFQLSGIATATLRTYTMPDASGTLALVGTGAVLNNPVANPAATTSLTAKMMGLGASCHLTPVNSTRVEFTICGSVNNNTAGDGATYRLAWGTGTAPNNGDATIGTAIGSAAVTVNTASGGGAISIPFSVTGLAIALTIGQPIWVDIQLAAVTGGSASIQSLNCTMKEVL